MYVIYNRWIRHLGVRINLQNIRSLSRVKCMVVNGNKNIVCSIQGHYSLVTSTLRLVKAPPDLIPGEIRFPFSTSSFPSVPRSG